MAAAPLTSAKPNRPGEFHPEPLTVPCATISRHSACAIPESRRPPRKPAGSSCFQWTQYDPSVDDPPPSLHHGSYSASSLLRDGPPLDSVLALFDASNGGSLSVLFLEVTRPELRFRAFSFAAHPPRPLERSSGR